MRATDPADARWHAPHPGPLYWSFRCLDCGYNVDEHPTVWARLRVQLRGYFDRLGW